MQGLPFAPWQEFRTVAGMVAVITAVLAGSTAALAAILISDHSLAAALISGGLVALLVLIALTRFQHSAWVAASTTPITEDEDKGAPPRGAGPEASRRPGSELPGQLRWTSPHSGACGTTDPRPAVR